MKTLYSILIFCLFCATNLEAQRGGGRNNDEGPRFTWGGDGMGNHIPTTFGMSGGVSLSNVGGFGTLISPCFSAFMAVPVNQHLCIRPELGYTGMGSSNSTSSFRADYFLIPVLASLQLNKNWYTVVGPQAAFLLSANQSTSGTKTDPRNQMHVQDMSFVGGLEYMPGTIGLIVRYQFGFTGNGLGNYNKGLRVGLNIKF